MSPKKPTGGPPNTTSRRANFMILPLALGPTCCALGLPSTRPGGAAGGERTRRASSLQLGPLPLVDRLQQVRAPVRRDLVAESELRRHDLRPRAGRQRRGEVAERIAAHRI